MLSRRSVLQYSISHVELQDHDPSRVICSLHCHSHTSSSPPPSRFRQFTACAATEPEGLFFCEAQSLHILQTRLVPCVSQKAHTHARAHHHGAPFSLLPSLLLHITAAGRTGRPPSAARRPRCRARHGTSPVVGRGHVSLLTDLDACQSKPFRDTQVM